MGTRLARIRPIDVDRARAAMPRAFARPLGERAVRAALLLLAAGYLGYLFWAFNFSPARLYEGLVSPNGLFVIAGQMVAWQGMAEWQYAEIFTALGQTVAMAFIGTLLTSVIAIPLGFLGARNIMPLGFLRFGFRRLFDGLRGVDQLIWALVFVRAVGLGPLAGILAICVSDIGSLSKLYAEAIETAEKKQIEGVRSTGASTLAVLRFGVLPQAIPLFLSQALYFFESNTRSATILGIVGAGGIGLQISERIKILAWDQVAFILILVLAVVALIDTLSKWLRLKLIGREAARG
jgi:phosphonate transport system permease protein